jgi:nitrite reductase/ring-hydroxylating ferredoxin subunit
MVNVQPIYRSPTTSGVLVPTSPTVGRRAVVLGSLACGVLGAGALSACSVATVASPSSGGSASGPIGSTSEVPVGGAAFFSGGVVVTQATAGSFAAFSTRCPHQGSLVSQQDGDQLVCPAHGSHFALDGSVVQGPAQTGLTNVPVSVEGDQLVLG